MGKSKTRQRSRKKQERLRIERLELEKEAEKKSVISSNELEVYSFRKISKEDSFENNSLGIRLKYEDIKKLRVQNKNPCGYLREPHFYQEKFTGLCALTKKFERCKFPRTLGYLEENDCPIYVSEINKMIEAEQRRLDKDKAKRL
jgi:hypothetical protein